MTTRSQIVDLLRTNDRAVARALVVLAARQTADEQASESTHHNNGRGFRPCHARMGTSMARFYQRFNRLSNKQIAYWRATMKDGKMRIEIYAGQLLEEAHAKQAKKNTAREMVDHKWNQTNSYAGQDVGNLMEQQMVLKEILSHEQISLGQLLDSEDQTAIDKQYQVIYNISRQIDQIDQAVRQAYQRQA